MNEEQFLKELNFAFNKIIMTNPATRDLFRNNSPANYRYYTVAGSKDRYFYTVGKVIHKGKPKFVAGIYRYLKSKKAYKLVRRAGFGRKKTAMARAFEWSKKGL